MDEESRGLSEMVAISEGESEIFSLLSCCGFEYRIAIDVIEKERE